MTSILSINSVSQSNLWNFNLILGVGPATFRRLMRLFSIYVTAWVAGVALELLSSSDPIQALGLGLIAPGAGFLQFAGDFGPQSFVAIGLALASFLAFLGAIMIWFATGMVLLPPAIWLATAFLAAVAGPLLPEAVRAPAAALIIPAVGPTLLVIALIAAGLRVAIARRANTDIPIAERTEARAKPSGGPSEMSTADIARVRLLLDRALQPVETFEGFEWRDQFQTAAIRYQLNFVSYALSIVQSAYAPACTAYFGEAQANLLAKQQNPLVWRYWQWESLWGHLSGSPDPFARDNIMFSGFVAAQIALADAASPHGRRLAEEPIAFRHRSGNTSNWTFDQLIENLVRQNEVAPFGLLACEPNWVYPLCNTITASAIRAGDELTDTQRWSRMSQKFGHGLQTEFMTPSGRLVPFRSSLIGLAGPQIGGAVMQAFPCLFLNATLPDFAQRQWDLVRRDLRHKGLRRALWPVDVGNYGFSRASSYAATAAAAAEMGDADLAGELLSLLDDDCPASGSGGISHRPNASLWAHAVEVMARALDRNAFRQLVLAGSRPMVVEPFVKHAVYPDILVAKAIVHDGALQVTFDPGFPGKRVDLGIGGLAPNERYRLDGAALEGGQADSAGEMTLRLSPLERVSISIRRAD